jgi:hypothetical protein
VDAVGVAMLKLMGTTPMVSAGEIFHQEQIERAAELGIGIDSPGKIEIVVADGESANFAQTRTPFIGASIRSTAVNYTGKLQTTWGEVRSI